MNIRLRQSVLLFLVFWCINQSFAQKIGDWKDYLSYNNALKVVSSPEKIYTVTEGGLFYFDLSDNSVNKYSSLVTLSDFGIKTIAYQTDKKVLIIAYKNSNIDLVYNDNQVINLSDIKRKQITGDKSINNITFIGNEAYLSCGFGIVVLNLEKQEVKDTYYIGPGGESVKVNDVDADVQMLFAATDNGLFKAGLNGTNLLDYNSWSQVQDIPHSTGKFNHLAFHAGNIIANYTPDEYNKDELYKWTGTVWERYNPRINFAHDMQVSNGYLVVASRAEVYVVDNSHSILGMFNEYNLTDETVFPISPRSVNVSADGNVWVADYKNALIRNSGSSFEKVFPGGPLDNNIFGLYQSGNGLWIAPGGTVGWITPFFQRFKNGQWDYFTPTNSPELEGFHNIVNMIVDPLDENHFFVSSWGGGLLEYRNDEFVARYTNLNSPLQSALPQEPESPYVRILGMDFDDQGNLWVSNSEVAKNLHKLSPDGQWESFVLPEVANRWNIGPVLVTQNNDKWITVLTGHDAYVVNNDGSQIKRLLVTSYFNNGTNEIYNRMNDIYSIVEDKDGAVWIGTSKGVAVYTNPERIWQSDEFYASQPSLDLGDGLYHPILESETVTSIAIDGANRKWLGTKNSGVYLMSETCEEEILHFTEENSPLLSNTINDIAINQSSGEVFFGTQDGLISYQGDAIGGFETYTDVYAYPNPVRETYNGPITITGLIENTDVKITDISGNLVYHTESFGGQAIWNGENLNGKRVKTGVYLVFCNNKTGEETVITKLLFIH